jgi:DNA-binding GntR family transcriptional regulator
VVRTTQGPLHRQVRTALSARIGRGELRPGERLPAERALSEEFGVARSVVRQALAGLARDGLVVSAYPRGYLVLGPRIPWLSRLRLLSDEPWDVEVISVREVPASRHDAATLGTDVGDPVAESMHELRGGESDEPWGLGLSSYPLDGLDAPARAVLLGPDMLDDADVEQAYGRRIVGYHERISARLPTDREQTSLDVGPFEPVLVVSRTTRTTTDPISHLTFIGRSDRFEVDYLIDA